MTGKRLAGALIASTLSLAAAAVLAAPASARAEAMATPARMELAVSVGKSQVLEIGRPYADVMIANPEVADVLPLTNHSVYVVGKKLGSTQLTIYGPGRSLIAATDVTVGPDIDSLKLRLHEILPDEEELSIRAANQSLLLSGSVDSGARLQQVVALAESYAPGQVVNMLSVRGEQQVMLSVRFVEMERTTAKALRINGETGPRLIDNGKNFNVNTGDSIISAVPFLTALDRFGTLTGFIHAGDIDLNILFDGLENKGLIKTLAEPNLVAMSGDTASFLAGGEFPVPVAQAASAGSTTISVEFKPFGIALGFTPTVLDDGVINMVVAPEVSAIDPTASIVTQGLTIPGIKVRRAKTTVELRDGESFTIAGLLKDDYQNQIRQFPFVGDVPVLGALFRSTGYQRNQSELVIVVTPHIVKATKGRMATPADRFLPPSELELFLLGVQRKGLSREDKVLLGVDPTKGGIDGPYGHVVY
jgi:pilus assembly protein CpaC